MKPPILFFIVVLLVQTGFAQSGKINKFYGERLIRTGPDLASRFQKFSVVKLESNTIASSLKGKSKVSFLLQLPDFPSWEIELQPSAITSAEYQLKIQTQSGVQIIPSNPNFLYKGKVRGSGKDEQVRLTIKEGFIYGSVQTEGKEYFIEPLNRFTTANKDEFIIYEAKDVLTNNNFSCGADEMEALSKAKEQNNLREQTPQSTICKKIKFISVADYSIYQKFSNDISAVETAILSNLNLAEGAFTSLNLGPDNTTDVGADEMKFEVKEIVVSSCKECDIISKAESAPDLGLEMNAWLAQQYPNQGNTIMQLWTQRSLFNLSGNPIGGISFNTIQCDQPARQILNYLSDEPAFLRMLTAHETGHLLGCRHDDEVKPDVKGFIMDSRASASSTRFSTLADFGGILYSSKKTIHDFVNFRNCLPDCDGLLCEDIKGLSVTYYNTSDSIGLKWNNAENFVVRFKEYDAVNYLPGNTLEVAGNNVTLKNLKSCTIYEVQVQKKCSDTEFGPVSSLVFNTSSLLVTGKPINNRGDVYDLTIEYACRNCSSENYIIKVDKKNFPVERNGQDQFIIKSLFADGARHRIDIGKDSFSSACTSSTFYDAPYYRANSTKILKEDFNNCILTNGWEDSLLAKSLASAPDARWLMEEKNSFSLNTSRGNFDSTCMIYYNRYNNFGTMYSGAVSLTSPVMDLTRYTDIKLHFDYNFLSVLASWNNAHPSFSIEIYNEGNWINIFKRDADSLPVNRIRRNIWDSLPPRVFIDLDKYRNKNIRLRFIADDGSLSTNESGNLFIGLDNIQIDGYLKDAIVNHNVVIYPNPTESDLFVQFRQPEANINYRIIDASGRQVTQGRLVNYRIDVKSLTAGMYLIEFFSGSSASKWSTKFIR